MKKLFVLILALGFLGFIQAQEDHSIFLQNNGPSGGRGILENYCPPGTVYSHDISLIGGFTSSDVFRVFDQVETTPAGLMDLLTFYGLDFYGYTSRVFQVEFYHDNSGAPGAAYYTDVATIPAVNVNGPFYSYTYNINPGISVSAGDWVSVYSEGDYWYWAFGSGGDGCVQQTSAGYRCDFGDAAFCLGITQEIPISPWAIALGIGLIALVVVLRTRRMI
jgi:hypothetical protein